MAAPADPLWDYDHAAPVAEEREFSGWWRRVGAYLVDGVVIGAMAAIMLVVVAAVFGLAFFADDTAGWTALVVGFLIWLPCVAVAALLYAPAMMARTNGRTVGRSVAGIRIVRADGQRITFGFAVVREVLVKWLLFGVVLGGVTGGLAPLLDYLWPLWDDEKRALHDYLVDTRTVRG